MAQEDRIPCPGRKGDPCPARSQGWGERFCSDCGGTGYVAREPVPTVRPKRVAPTLDDGSVAQGNDAPEAKAEGRAISKALASLVTKAKAMGCKNPSLFFEAESRAVFVFDDDHPAMTDKSIDACSAERQEAIVLRCSISTTFDTGAW